MVCSVRAEESDHRILGNVLWRVRLIVLDETDLSTCVRNEPPSDGNYRTAGTSMAILPSPEGAGQCGESFYGVVPVGRALTRRCRAVSTADRSIAPRLVSSCPRQRPKAITSPAMHAVSVRSLPSTTKKRKEQAARNGLAQERRGVSSSSSSNNHTTR
jgi:hypothetical protein